MAKATSKRPTRDEFELEELGNTIVEAKPMILPTFSPLGHMIQRLNTKIQVDGITRQLELMEMD